MRFGRKETPIDQLRGVAVTALVTALQEGGALDQLQQRTLDQLQNNKKSSPKRGRTPVKTLAAGAGLYTAGRIAYQHRDELESLIEGVIDVDDVEEVDDPDEMVDEVGDDTEDFDEPEAEEDEDFDEEDEVEDEPEAEEDEDFDEEDEPEAEEDEDFDEE